MNKHALINESHPWNVYTWESLFLTVNFIVNVFHFNVDSFCLDMSTPLCGVIVAPYVYTM